MDDEFLSWIISAIAVFALLFIAALIIGAV